MASRRQNQGVADKAAAAAANQQVIKSLLKLPGNKYCADCKRNKLPRWASWNLGIFICIRCSGIHRGMGTHISRVKSVDLDSWTDEQLQSMVKWGNTRANKYWEANLAPGHVPSEAKIENFVRTKYESKRWVADGGIPDPSTLDDSGDDELPLKVVKQQLENRQAPTPSAPSVAPPQLSKAPVNLFDDDPEPIKVAPIATASRTTQVASKGDPAPPKSSRPGDSLLGLDDFFGAPQQPTSRPSSTGPNQASAAKTSRPDLNRSILSLYSSAPKQPVRAPGHQQSPSIGSMGSVGLMGSAPPQQQQPQPSAFGDLNDAFGGLSFAPQPQVTAQPPKPSPFANLASPMSSRAPVAPQLSPVSSGGGFFGAPAQRKPDAFSSMSPSQNATSASSGLNDLFSLSSATSHANPTPAPVTLNSPSKPISNAFGFDNAWANPSAPAAAPVSTQTNVWGSSSNTSAFAGLGTSSLANKKTDDDFGAFTGGGVTSSNATKVDDDLFANVWG